MRPPAGISGSASWARARGAITLTRYTRSISANGYSARAGIGLGPSSLALLTSRSTRSPAASISAPRCQSSATSPAMAVTRPGPTSLSSWAARSSAVGSASVEHEVPAVAREREGEGEPQPL